MKKIFILAVMLLNGVISHAQTANPLTTTVKNDEKETLLADIYSHALCV